MIAHFIGKEARAKDLIARIKKVKAIQSQAVMSSEWAKPGVPKKWIKAYDAQKKLERTLGRLIANYCYLED